MSPEHSGNTPFNNEHMQQLLNELEEKQPANASGTESTEQTQSPIVPSAEDEHDSSADKSNSSRKDRRRERSENYQPHNENAEQDQNSFRAARFAGGYAAVQSFIRGEYKRAEESGVLPDDPQESARVKGQLRKDAIDSFMRVIYTPDALGFGEKNPNNLSAEDRKKYEAEVNVITQLMQSRTPEELFTRLAQEYGEDAAAEARGTYKKEDEQLRSQESKSTDKPQVVNSADTGKTPKSPADNPTQPAPVPPRRKSAPPKPAPASSKESAPTPVSELSPEEEKKRDARNVRELHKEYLKDITFRKIAKRASVDKVDMDEAEQRIREDFLDEAFELTDEDREVHGDDNGVQAELDHLRSLYEPIILSEGDDFKKRMRDTFGEYAEEEKVREKLGKKYRHFKQNLYDKNTAKFDEAERKKAEKEALKGEKESLREKILRWKENRKAASAEDSDEEQNETTKVLPAEEGDDSKLSLRDRFNLVKFNAIKNFYNRSKKDRLKDLDDALLTPEERERKRKRKLMKVLGGLAVAAGTLVVLKSTGVIPDWGGNTPDPNVASGGGPRTEALPAGESGGGNGGQQPAFEADMPASSGAEGFDETTGSHEATPEYSAEAFVIDKGEGFYQTFKDLDIPKEDWPNLLEKVGPQLADMEYSDGTSVAYFDNKAGEWRLHVSPDGKMPQSVLDTIADAHEQLDTSGAEAVADTKEAAEKPEVPENVETFEQADRIEGVEVDHNKQLDKLNNIPDGMGGREYVKDVLGMNPDTWNAVQHDLNTSGGGADHWFYEMPDGNIGLREGKMPGEMAARMFNELTEAQLGNSVEVSNPASISTEIINDSRLNTISDIPAGTNIEDFMKKQGLGHVWLEINKPGVAEQLVNTAKDSFAFTNGELHTNGNVKVPTEAWKIIVSHMNEVEKAKFGVALPKVS